MQAQRVAQRVRQQAECGAQGGADEDGGRVEAALRVGVGVGRMGGLDGHAWLALTACGYEGSKWMLDVDF